MGIKSINVFLREKVPNAFLIEKTSKLANFRVAIDGSLKLFTLMSAANKACIERLIDPLEPINRQAIINKTEELLISFLVELTELSLMPVWIFDGKPLDAKIKCKAKRSSSRDSIKKKIEDKKKELSEIHPFLRSREDIESLKGLMTQVNSVSREETQLFIMILKNLGFPCLIANNEGEKLCSSLAREGLAIAVWGNDTDNYALGTPLLITGINKHEEHGKVFEIVDLRVILKEIGKSHKWFVDLCILSGCDFNSNIPGIGPSKAYKMLEEYGSIENIDFKLSKAILNRIEELNEEGENIDLKDSEKIKKIIIEQLNYQICREIFEIEDSGFDPDSEELNFSHDNFLENYEKVFEESSTPKYLITKLINSVKNITKTPKTIKLKLEK